MTFNAKNVRNNIINAHERNRVGDNNNNIV